MVARSLAFCMPLPPRPTARRDEIREARIGERTFITVSSTASNPRLPLPHGSDRAALASCSTFASRGQVTAIPFTPLMRGYLKAFQLADSGSHYRAFAARLERLSGLTITIDIRSPEGPTLLTFHPIAALRLPAALAPGLTLFPPSETAELSSLPGGYGIVLDSRFAEFTLGSRTTLPLALMRWCHNNPRAWDLVGYVYSRTRIARNPSQVSWPQLVKQLGLTTDSNTRRTRRLLASYLDEVRRRFYSSFPSFLDERGTLHISPWNPTGRERQKEPLCGG